MNRVLHYDRGSSDKVYIGSVVEQAGGKFKVICKWGRRHGSVQAQGKGVFNSRSQAVSELNTILQSKEKKGYVDIESSSYGGSLTMSNHWLKAYLENDNAATAVSMETLIAPTTGKEVERVISDAAKQQAVDLLKKGQRINAVKAVRSATNCLLEPAKEYVEQILEPQVKTEKEMVPAAGEKDFEVVCVNNLGMEESFDEGVTYVAEPHSEDGYIYVWDRNADKQEVFAERFEKAKTEAIA